jgi:RNA recognition motif-containing protein
LLGLCEGPFQRQPHGLSGIHLLLRKETNEMNVYVGNLSYEVTEDDLKQAFGAFGQIKSVNVIKDKYNGMSKGFGFVEMDSKEEAQAAIAGMNGKDLKGRTLNVNEARPRTDSRGGRDGRSGGGGGGGGGRNRW